MQPGFLQRFHWIFKILQPVIILGFAVFTGLIVSAKAEFATLLFEVALFLIVIVISRGKVANLVLAFIITDHLCQFFKRFVFLWGPQSRGLYYAMQVLPDLFMLIAAILVFRTITRSRTTRSAKFLMAFAGASILMSLINVRAVTFGAGVAGLHQALFPLFALLVGMTLSLGALGGIARVFSGLILISVPYGIYQFIMGPTAMDRAWAEALHETSIEAAKVYQALTLRGSEFRAYSYYADHTTWGLFLALSSIVVVMAGALGLFPRKWLYLVVPTAMVGLVICETRTAWLAFLATIVVYRIIRTRILRRPMLIVFGVLSSFAVVVTLGDYVAHHVNFGAFSNALLTRYATVGTMEARTSAWKLFARNLAPHFLLGTGFGYANSDANVSLSDEVFSHNMYVELLVTTGLPGLLLFLGFFYYWIKEAFWVAKVGTPAESRAALWSIALAVGMLLTGSVQGMNFMNMYLCLVLGFTSGEWLRVTKLRNIPVPVFATRPRGQILQPVG